MRPSPTLSAAMGRIAKWPTCGCTGNFLCLNREITELLFDYKCFWVFLMSGRLRGWGRCPGAVSHPGFSLMVASMKPLCFGGSLLPGQLCRAGLQGARGERFGFASGTFQGRTKPRLLPNEGNCVLLHMFLLRGQMFLLSITFGTEHH